MTTERFFSDAISVGASRQIVRRLSRIVALAGALFAIFAASAQAHIVTATAACGSVSFNWSRFSSSGYGNGGLNTPQWIVAFKPVVGSTATIHGAASFPGSSFSLAVPIPSGNGSVTVSSSWTWAQTRDGNSNSGSQSFTIGNCPVIPPPETPPTPAISPVPDVPSSPVASPNFVARSASLTLALSTNGSVPVTLGGAIRDTAVLSGGTSPTGTLAFSLYSASDSNCSKALRQVTVPVSGSGNYVSPPITPATAGSYQWVASYSGDANNKSLSGSCGDPTERSIVTAKIGHPPHPVCVTPQATLRGLPETARNSLSAGVAARGVKSVTFYLDGRKVVTLSKPSHRRFSVSIDARRLSFGAHRLKAKVTMRDPTCTSAEAAGTFIHVKPPSLPPKFAG
jgi:hypothetical protein